jgi:hypothetical protein
MGKVLDALDANLTAIVTRQPVWFVAPAPSAAGGHVNVSPQGGTGSFAVMDPTTVGARRVSRPTGQSATQ